jgi:hypothetical protein
MIHFLLTTSSSAEAQRQQYPTWFLTPRKSVRDKVVFEELTEKSTQTAKPSQSRTSILGRRQYISHISLEVDMEVGMMA